MADDPGNNLVAFPRVEVRRQAGGGNGGTIPPMDHAERIAKLEAALPTLGTKSDLAELRADMHEMNAGISRWMLGTVVTVIGTVVLGFAGLTLQLSNSLKPIQPQAQPTVIVLPQPPAPAASR